MENVQNCRIELIEAKVLYPDEAESAKISAEKYGKKLAKMGFDTLRLKFKTHGNAIGTHLRKVEVDVSAIKGKNLISIKKELSKERHNWNVGKLVQEALEVVFENAQKEATKNI